MPVDPNIELRDWLAAHALAGILASPNAPKVEALPFEQHADSVAEQAYAYADAMLRRRGKPAEPPRPGSSPDEAAGSFSAAAGTAEAAARPRAAFPGLPERHDVPLSAPASEPKTGAGKQRRPRKGQ